jgi:hypothetical protein
VAEGISSLNLRKKQTILHRISKPCKGKPNSHAWNIQWSFRSNRLPFIPTRGTRPPQATVGLYAHNCAGCMSVARLHDHTPVRMCETYAYSVHDCRTYSHPLRNVLPHVGACAKNQITSGGRYVHSSGRLVTRLTAYHISRHVASTFKHLTTATTHCDLIKFINTDGVSSQPWYLS